MKVLRAVIVTCVVLLAGLGVVSAQTWTPLTNQPTFSASTAFILPDGRVMVQDTGAQDWWALSPDANGGYLNGTWSQLASLPAGYAPLYYASAVLPDGRLALLGGEYNFGNADWTTLGAIYTPKTNKWKTLIHPAGWTSVGDAQSVILANGTMMVANCCTTDEALLKRAIESVHETKLDAKLDPLAKIAADPKRTGPTRAAALETVFALFPALSPSPSR